MRRLWWGTAGVTLAYAALLATGDLDHHRALLAAVVVPFWVVSLCVIAWATRGPAHLGRPVVTMALVAAVVQLPGLFVPPRDSSDAYRYVWDGRVQLSGTSPYRFVPLDDRLAALRDPALFPGLGPRQRSGVRTEPLPTSRADLLVRARDDPRTLINRPAVPTAYPPVAEAWFATVAALTPWAAGTLGLQLGSAILAIAIAAALAGWLSRRGRDPREALWWAWCPSVVITAGNSAHVDVLAAALMVAAALVAGRVTTPRTLTAAGALLGLAAGVKLLPLVVAPALMPLHRNGYRRTLIAPAAALVTLGLVYLPHLLTAGSLVEGYLPGYLLEESGQNRAALLRLFIPVCAVPYAIAGALAVGAVWALRRASVGDAAGGATVLFGVLILATTPSYPWYSVPLVALAVPSGRFEWLAVAFAGWIAYAGVRVPPVSGFAFAAAALAVAAAWGLRRRNEQGPGKPRVDPPVDNHCETASPPGIIVASRDR
jgi:hypothetical protein